MVLGDVGVFQCIKWRFVSETYWKTHVSLHVIIFVSQSGLLVSRFMMPEQMFFWVSFCSWVRIFGTILQEFLSHLIHDGKFLYCLFAGVHHISVYSSAQTTVCLHYTIKFLNFSFCFRNHTSTGKFIIFNLFPILKNHSNIRFEIF